MTNTKNPPVDYSPQLDGLRAIAIALVLIAHVIAIGLKMPGLWQHANALGGLGVNVFFVLSGYLITALLVRESEVRGRIDLRKFYVRRSLRIIPALVTYVAVVAVLKLVGLVDDVRWIDFAICLLYVRNVFGDGPTFHHTWSLALEEQFYLMWPPALRALGRKRALVVAIVLALAVNAWRIYSRLFIEGIPGPVLYFRPDYRFDSILCGCALALGAPVITSSRAALAALRVGNALVVVPIAIAWTIWQNIVQTERGVLLLPVQTALAALLVASVAWTSGGAARALLASRPMVYVGKLSYSLYLWQQLFLVTRYPEWGIREFPRDLACTALAAVGSYYLVEGPFLKLKARFAA